MAEQNLLAQLDAAIGDFIGSWDYVSTFITIIVLIVVLGPLFTGQEPDVHPFLLARQSQASPIRQPGESAVYRSNDLPYGYPLRAGLAVKDAGAPKWTSGRDGDIRDIWRQAVNGPRKDDGSSAGPRGKIMTILGSQKILEHDIDSLTAEINTIGKYIQDAGGKKVAVCLSNSAELLSTIFAAAFYQFSPVLVPYGQKPQDNVPLIAEAGADTLVAEAGSIALHEILSKKSSIKRIIWVTKAGNNHLDWNEVPEGVGGKIEVSTWHDLVDEKKASASTQALPVDKETTPPPLLTFWPTNYGKYELVEYSSQNITSAVAALIASLPRNHKLNSSDIMLPTSPLTDTYALAWTLAALFSNASLALNSVAGENVDIAASAHGVQPTIVVASSTSVMKYYERVKQDGVGSAVSTYFAKRSLAAGSLPLKKSGPITTTNLANLKTLLVAQRDSAPAASRIPSSVLGTLRLATSARIGYALTTAKVAGAVCQTNLLDYRDKGNVICVGGPVSSVEAYLTGDEEEMQKPNALGNIVVRGPAVAGGENVGGKKQSTVLKIEASVDVDHTFLLV